MIDLTDRVALVTGGSRGIGRATVLKLAAAGADVIVNYISSQTAARELAEQVSALGRKVAIVKGDVSEPEDVQAMLEFVGNEFGRLDILVSNAASGGFRRVMDASPKHFDAAMHTNARALMLLAQAAQGIMARDGAQPSTAIHRRKIISLSSHGSHRALPAYGLIGASKAALESLSRHLALELGPLGINVNVVLAGLVETDSTRHLPHSEQAFAAVQQRRLVGDLVLTPEAVADVVLFLASPLSDLVQGETIVVDGGEALHGV